VNRKGSPLGDVVMVATTLYVSHIDAAIDWYRDKLGLEPTTVGTDDFRFAGYLLGGSFVVLEPIEAAVEVTGPPESTTVNIIIENDPADVFEALMSRGVACSGLAESPGYQSFFMRDLDGNRFYVTRPRSSEAQESVRTSIEDAPGLTSN
jgi:catechol 2,3-dioxygenase-like lactoylglutathione lyase family enzyme